MTVDNDRVTPMSEYPIFRVLRMPDAISTFRSKDVISSDVMFAGAHREVGGEGETCLREYTSNGLNWTNGNAHRSRRKLLNQLVRPGALDIFRDEIVTPQAETLLPRSVTGPHPDGKYRMELVQFCDRVFLHFSASLIGLVGIDTDEQMEQLRECVFPLSVAVTSAYHKDRALINAAARVAKQEYIEQFYQPSLDAYRSLLAEVEAGHRPEEDLPLSFMGMVARGAHPDYVGEQAIMESVILFVASVGTSTQSIVNTVADLSGWFESHPEDYARRSDHDFLLNALQESLRLRAPFVPFMLRMAARDTEIGGCPVRRGQEIHIPLQVANRDPAIWGSSSHKFDPCRVVPEEQRRYGIAFGVGEHQCLGLRVVMGSDGTGGAHVRVLQLLFAEGVCPDPANPPHSMEQVEDVAADKELPRWVSYPTVLEDWQPEVAG